MNIASYIALCGVSIALVTLLVQQARIFMLDKRRKYRAQTKLEIFYEVQTKQLTEEQIFNAQEKKHPQQKEDRVEVRNAIYEMLKEGTLKYDPSSNTFTVSHDVDKEASSQMEYRQKENAFSLIRQWENDNLKHARDLIREIKKDPESWIDKKVKETIEANKDIERSVVTMLNHFQVIYLSIINDQASAGVLKQAFCETYRFTHESLFKWFQGRAINDPVMCKDLVALYVLWYDGNGK